MRGKSANQCMVETGLTCGIRGLNQIVPKLEKAAKSESPADLFEVDTPSLLSRIFNLGSTYDPTEQICEHLGQIVKNADQIIQETFHEHVSGTMTVWRARFDAHRNKYLTYLPVSNDPPFKATDMEMDVPVVSAVSILPASPAWMAILIAPR